MYFNAEYKSESQTHTVVIFCNTARVLSPHQRDKHVFFEGFCEALLPVREERQRSSQTYRLEEEQRPNIIPLRVDHFIQHAEPEPLLPVRVFGVVDTVLQMPFVLFHDGDRTPRHASLSVKRRSSSASIRASTLGLRLQSILQEQILLKTATTITLTCGDVQRWKRSSGPLPAKKKVPNKTVGAATQEEWRRDPKRERERGGVTLGPKGSAKYG